MSDLGAVRARLEVHGLDVDDLTDDPLDLFRRWYSDAQDAGVHQPEAMVLSTATVEAVPSGRFVLLRGLLDDGFAFYTNRNSRKAAELDTNGWASLVFPWIQMSRQVRVEGVVTRTSDQDSDEYFRTRPRGAQIGAWASDQSTVILDRSTLDQRVAELTEQFGDGEVPRPPHWGGYRVRPRVFEFWQGRQDRLHDRFRYDLVGRGRWSSVRLAP